MPKKIAKAELSENKSVVWNKDDANRLFNESWFGELIEDGLELSLVETAFLLEKGRIELFENKKKVTMKKLYKQAQKIDPRFVVRYIVYKDMRERGLPVRTGFKFGCDFRVYDRGIKPVKKGPKAPHEHTKWIVFCVPEDYACSFQELSRAVRLAHNIRSSMLWAIVDNENDVTYYNINYLSP
ncbi:MAG: tRNA-intron lyase [Candidatus Aenigmarchaeota archaeon]|nr:tRNA-intron lyase [Candidatus Aenigmarchaeota archaeon]